MPEKPAPEPRFAADCMLGTLAKWLRILGYDTLYLNQVEDAELIGRARAENRIILTRDRRLTERRRAAPFLLVTSEKPMQQLREVAGVLGLEYREERLLTRCLRCNVPTGEATREEVREEVPPYVLATQSRFRRCPSCRRVYWGATHRESMLARLRAMLGAATGSLPSPAPEADPS